MDNICQFYYHIHIKISFTIREEHERTKNELTSHGDGIEREAESSQMYSWN